MMNLEFPISNDIPITNVLFLKNHSFNHHSSNLEHFIVGRKLDEISISVIKVYTRNTFENRNIL